MAAREAHRLRGTDHGSASVAVLLDRQVLQVAGV